MAARGMRSVRRAISPNARWTVSSIESPASAERLATAITASPVVLLISSSTSSLCAKWK